MTMQKTVALLIALLTLITVAIGAWREWHNDSSEQATTFNFAGSVIDAGKGTAISNASVATTADQNQPQIILTDMNGMFSVQLPSQVKALTINVNAANYQRATVIANPRRTGPEVIPLTPLHTQLQFLPRPRDRNPTIIQKSVGDNSPNIIGDHNQVP